MNASHGLFAALRGYPPNARALVLAYSGGRDSSALLHALAQADWPIPLRAVHVCHHLEPDAENWAAHCQRRCRALGVEFMRRDIRVDTNSGGLEAAAREARYAVLEACIAAGEVLVTAHHAEDQAETFLLQALRGAGVAGLAGMPGQTAFGAGWLWRPWLGVPRQTITAYAQAERLDWIEDQTNRDSQRARGYLRSRIWPELTARWPAAATTLSRSAAWSAQAAEAVAALAELDRAGVEHGDGTLSLDALTGLSSPRQAEVVRLWLDRLSRDRPDHRHLAEVQRLIGAREHAGPRVVFAQTEIRRFDGRLFAMRRLPAAPAPAATILWPRGLSAIELPTGCGRITIESALPAWPDDLRIVFNEAGVRAARAGGGTTPLSELMRAARVPVWIRERIPRIHAGDTLLAVPGVWQHPRDVRWFGGQSPIFDWQHDLPGHGSGR